MKKHHPELEQLGKNLRRLRKKKGLSQESLAFESKIAQTYISEVEHGKRNISALNLIRIAKVLGVTFDQMFEKY